MRILLIMVFCLIQNTIYAYKFVKYSDNIVGYNYHIINDSSFNYYKKYIDKTISKKLSPRHTQLISEIIITDSYIISNDTDEGICYFQGDSIIVLISTQSYNLDKTIYHEMSHAMKFTFDGSAWLEIETQWKKCNRFVTEYAKKDIDEDFAEIGAYYLTGHYNPKNKKYDLFKYFIDRI